MLTGLLIACGTPAPSPIAESDPPSVAARPRIEPALPPAASLTEVPPSAALTAPVAAGARELPVDRPALVAGAEVLVHQTTGAGAGRFARARIEAVGDGSLTLTAPLDRGFDAPGAQVLGVVTGPHVRVEGALAVPAWDGLVGGVIAFDVGRLVVDGAIDADGAGLRGGVAPGARHAQSCLAPDDPRSAERGEGVDGERGRTGFGAPSTGGGGGNCHNAGGGGGGNAGTGGQGGWSWVNEANGRGDVGGRGGRALTDGLTLGGGGGAGQSDRPPAPGGAGGGAVWIRADAVLGDGRISARGAPGVGPPREGAGGGGAGGTLWIDAAQVDVALDVSGGRGADALEASLGPGGGGGGGRVVTRPPVEPRAVLDGGDGGVDPTGSAWGATAGARGHVRALPTGASP